jgi:hypothetical protein
VLLFRQAAAAAAVGVEGILGLVVLLVSLKNPSSWDLLLFLLCPA